MSRRKKPAWKRRAINLSRAGPEWQGWYVGPWGHSGQLWLIAPDGTRFDAAEILSLHALQRDLDYFQVRTRELQTLNAPGAVSFTPAEMATIAAAAAIVQRRAPRQAARRAGNVVEIGTPTKPANAPKVADS